MKVLLIGNYDNDKLTSMQKFANLLYELLVTRGINTTLAKPNTVLNRFPELGRPICKFLGYIDKFVIFPFKLKLLAKNFDIIHICDHSNSPYLRFLKHKQTIITCHDLIAIRSAIGEIPEQKIRYTGRIFQKIILSSLKFAKHIICVSLTTQNDVNRLVINKPTSCIRSCLNHPYKRISNTDAVKKLNLELKTLGTNFFMHIGNNSWYKNKIGVLRIFSCLTKTPEFNSHKLALIGDQPSEEILTEVSRLGINDKVIFFENIADDQLEAFYSLAYALLFPSLYEGFGWPIIEAQSCGCPVITSNRNPMMEIAGTGALFIDPTDPTKAAEYLIKELHEEKRQELIKYGYENLKRFTSEAMIDHYLSTYNSLI